MKKFVFALTAALAITSAGASKPAQTLEVSVQGLNCALCGDALKASLKKVTGARDLEPRLECGRIYLEVDADKAKDYNEAGLTFTLTANGFNLEGVRPVSSTLAQVRATKTC